MNLFFKNNKNRKALKKGFTLIELLITITMFVMITGIVLFNSNSFDSSVLLHNFAYDVALTIKQAQSYGVNVKENSIGIFDYDYGVYFDTVTADYRTHFILFNDVPPVNGVADKYYTNSASVSSCPTDNPECIQKYTIKNGSFIKSVCAGDDADHCTQVNQLSILFHRPNLGAEIYTNNQSINPQLYANIILSAKNGATTTIVVTKVGQIYIKKY